MVKLGQETTTDACTYLGAENQEQNDTTNEEQGKMREPSERGAKRRTHDK
jgi:hypothetical protein